MNRRDSIKILTAGAASLFGTNLPVDGEGIDERPTKESPATDFESKREAYAVVPEFTLLRFGAVKPRGWLKEQMLRDLRTGFAGCLDKLCPDAGSDVFVAGRSSELITRAGRRPHPAWWFGESEGNWRAGWIMLAYLSEDPSAMAAVDRYIDHLLSSQAPDGYIGVFGEPLRYKTPGDLWTQSRILLALLAYAECTRSEKAFTAVIRCCEGILAAHADAARSLDWSQSHDVMISDVLERLFELTGDKRYRDFAIRCYREWSAVAHDNIRVQGDDDATLGVLTDPGHNYFLGHSVHTVEHLRVPIWLAAATGKPNYQEAARNGIARTVPYSFLTGCIVGNGIGGPPNHRFREFIDNSAPDPYEGEWEYCTARETQVTFTSALQKTGDLAHADRVECVFFNAAQSGRLPDGSALTYMTAENRLSCNGRTQDGHAPEPRNTFSPTSEEVAVCCNPNGTQVSSHFVRSMWMRHRDGGLAALLYGPAIITTDVSGVSITIEETTNYPFEHHVDFAVQPEHEIEFTLHFRTPSWSSEVTVDCPGAQIKRDGLLVHVTKSWNAGDHVQLTFHPKVQGLTASNQEIALQYGPLLFALPIASKSCVAKTYRVSGFQDTYFEPVTLQMMDLAFLKTESGELDFTPIEQQDGNALRPFDRPLLVLQGNMANLADNTQTRINLVPFGNAVPLRRLTFPLHGKAFDVNA